MTRKDFVMIAQTIGTNRANMPDSVNKGQLAFVMQLLSQTFSGFNPRRFMDSIAEAENAQKAAQEAAESERQEATP